MSKKNLTEENIHSSALEKMGEYHEETLSEVIKSVSEDKIVLLPRKSYLCLPKYR